MSLLLDTNAFLWLGRDPARLGESARAAIAGAPAHVSVASYREIAIKVSIGKLDIEPDAFVDGAKRAGLAELAPNRADCLRVAELPLHHRDPLYRMLVARALERGLALVSSDRRLAAYGVELIPCG